jgi:hypothetical protein
MGFSSQAGQLLLRTQAVVGTYQADTPTNGIGIKVKSGTFGPNRDLMIPDPEIGGGRDIADANLGTVSWSGDFEFYGRVDSLLTLLYAALGSKAISTTTGVSTHTFTPSDAAQLPFLSCEEAVGASMEVFNYTDTVVNTLHFEAEANGFLQGTVGMIAIKQTAGHTRTATPDWDNGSMFVGSNILVTYNGVTLPAKSFSFDLNNNFEDDDFRLGSFYIGDLTPKGREVTASFSIRESSIALWRKAVYGTSGATEAGGLTSKSELVIHMETYDTIPLGTPTTAYSIDISIPQFALTPYALSVSGSDIIDDDLDGQALRPDPGDSIAVVTAVTGRTAVA